MKPILLIATLISLGLQVVSCDNPKSAKEVVVNSTDKFNPIKKTEFYVMDTLKKVPNDIKALVNGKITRVFKVDFNGDGKEDFICQYEPIPAPDESDYFFEDWITSEHKIFKKEKKYFMDADYYWFVNIDKDPEPEIFAASGYEDGIDYAFLDQDLKTGEETLLFYINPIILENGKKYWGYPWDIKDLILKKDSTTIYLQASIDHDIVRDENITIPDTTKKFPAIFFHGHSTQPQAEFSEIRSIRWMTANELK